MSNTPKLHSKKRTRTERRKPITLPKPTGQLAFHMQTRLDNDEHIQALATILIEAFRSWKKKR